MLFPVAPVEELDRDVRGLRVEAAHVHVDAVGIRARDVERLDPARAAELVVGDAGAEAVGDELVLAAQQAELRLRHDQVHEARHRADGAAAVEARELLGRLHFEGDGAAMAMAVVDHLGV